MNKDEHRFTALVIAGDLQEAVVKARGALATLGYPFACLEKSAAGPLGWKLEFSLQGSLRG